MTWGLYSGRTICIKQISPTSETVKPPKDDSNYKASKPTEIKEIAHTADVCISQRLMALGEKFLTMCRPNASRDLKIYARTYGISSLVYLSATILS